MMSVRPATPWTYDDYVEFPDDGKRYEIVEGKVFVTPAPNLRHQEIVGLLFVRMYEHARRNGGGRVFVAPVDTVLSPTNVVQPDILYVADADTPRITAANLQGPPTLAVEVLSDPRHDRVRKRRLYAQFGVAEYWIVDPDGERVEVHRLAGSEYPTPTLLEAGTELSTPLLPGFAMPVAELLDAGR
jgi:Uma2 family endonuclease